MRRQILFLGLVIMAVALSAAPAAAGGAQVDRLDGPLEGIPLPVADDPRTIGFADCAFVVRVERPDGTARETQQCELTGFFLQIIDGEIIPCEDCYPEHAFNFTGQECQWASEFWLFSTDFEVWQYAETWSVTVTPSGQVRATSDYAADPPDRADCGFE